MNFGEITINDKKALNPTNRELGSAEPLKDLFARTAGFATMPFGGISQLVVDAQPAEASFRVFDTMPSYNMARKILKPQIDFNGQSFVELPSFFIRPDHNVIQSASEMRRLPMVKDVFHRNAKEMEQILGKDLMNVEIGLFDEGSKFDGTAGWFDPDRNLIGIHSDLYNIKNKNKLSKYLSSSIDGTIFHELDHANDYINNGNRANIVGSKSLEDYAKRMQIKNNLSDDEMIELQNKMYLNQIGEANARLSGQRHFLHDKFIDTNSPDFIPRNFGLIHKDGKFQYSNMRPEDIYVMDSFGDFKPVQKKWDMYDGFKPKEPEFRVDKRTFNIEAMLADSNNAFLTL